MSLITVTVYLNWEWERMGEKEREERERAPAAREGSTKLSQIFKLGLLINSI